MRYVETVEDKARNSFTCKSKKGEGEMIGISIIVLIVLYLFVSFKGVEYVYDKSQKKRYAVLATLFFILLPTWDVIIGKIYFNYLCKMQSGLKVYKSVDVDGFLTKNSIAIGDSSFYKNIGLRYIEGTNSGWKGKETQYLDLTDANQTIQFIKEPQSKYVFIYNEKSKPIKWLPIVKNRALVKDRITDEILGEDIGFDYFGAWIGIVANHLVSGVSNLSLIHI